MPYIEVKVFEDRFEDPSFSQRMVEAVTQAMTSVLGEEVGAESPVIVEGVPRNRWGHGGKLMG